MVLLSMGVIILNERQADIAKLARESRVVQPDDPAAPSNTLVSVTGTIETDQAGLGDGEYLVPGDYLLLERSVEMYAWEKYERGKDSNGRPEYEERKVWTRSPSLIRNNPSMTIK